MRDLVVRVGVVVCVACACLVGAGKLDDALAVFDFQADANAKLTFNERNYPEIEGLEGWTSVLEDARLWMPEDATYRLVSGSGGQEATALVSPRTYLHVLLMPRRETGARSATWIFCYGCTSSTLGREYDVLSGSGHGLVFARRRS